MRLIIALALVLLARVAAAAPLDDALKQLVERFRALADAHGLTAEIYTRCTKQPNAAKQLRNNLIAVSEQLQRETGVKTPLKDVAERAFSAGRKRGSELLCSDKPEAFAADWMTKTKDAVNESLARIAELKQQQKATKPQ